MEFDKSRVYTAVNADELKIGSKVIVSDCMFNLRQYVNENKLAQVLEDIQPDYAIKRFVVSDVSCGWNLAYLVSEPEEKKLKWTDLKVGDIVHEKNGTETRMVTAIDTSNEPDEEGDVCHICLADWWPSEEALEDWEKVE